MTVEQGFGMLALGLAAIAIGATIIFFVINKMEKEDKEAKENEKVKKIYDFTK